MRVVAVLIPVVYGSAATAMPDDDYFRDLPDLWLDSLIESQISDREERDSSRTPRGIWDPDGSLRPCAFDLMSSDDPFCGCPAEEEDLPFESLTEGLTSTTAIPGEFGFPLGSPLDMEDNLFGHEGLLGRHGGSGIPEYGGISFSRYFDSSMHVPIPLPFLSTTALTPTSPTHALLYEASLHSAEYEFASAQDAPWQVRSATASVELWDGLESQSPFEVPEERTQVPTARVIEFHSTRVAPKRPRRRISRRRAHSEDGTQETHHPKPKRLNRGDSSAQTTRASASASGVVPEMRKRGLGIAERRCILEALIVESTLATKQVYFNCHSILPNLKESQTRNFMDYLRKRLRMPKVLHDHIVRSAARIHAGLISRVVSEFRAQHALACMSGVGLRKAVETWYRHCVVPLSEGRGDACHAIESEGNLLWKLSEETTVVVLQELVSELK